MDSRNYSNQNLGKGYWLSMICKSHSHFSVNQWRKCHHGVRARTLQDNWLFKDKTLPDFTRHAFLSTSLALQSKFAESWDVELFLLELGSCPGSNLLDFHSGLVITLLHFSNKTAMLALQTCPTRCTGSQWKKVRQETRYQKAIYQSCRIWVHSHGGWWEWVGKVNIDWQVINKKLLWWWIWPFSWYSTWWWGWSNSERDKVRHCGIGDESRTRALWADQGLYTQN